MRNDFCRQRSRLHQKSHGLGNRHGRNKQPGFHGNVGRLIHWRGVTKHGMAGLKCARVKSLMVHRVATPLGILPATNRVGNHGNLTSTQFLTQRWLGVSSPVSNKFPLPFFDQMASWISGDGRKRNDAFVTVDPMLHWMISRSGFVRHPIWRMRPLPGGFHQIFLMRGLFERGFLWIDERPSWIVYVLTSRRGSGCSPQSIYVYILFLHYIYILYTHYRYI